MLRIIGVQLENLEKILIYIPVDGELLIFVFKGEFGNSNRSSWVSKRRGQKSSFRF